jgi:endoglucanase
LGRRALLASPAATLLPGGRAEAAAVASDQGQWLAWRARFLAEDGRVVDTGNGGISHSEGQGYGLLLAEAFNDRPSFERMLAWTRAKLLRADGLHAWRWQPGPGITDRNNATDGDLTIAWALLRAAERWEEPAWTAMALRIGRVAASWLLPEIGGRVLLLPGADGFLDQRRVVLNPSTYIFPALAALAAASGDPRWRRASADGLALLRQACFGRWSLPADWVQLPAGQRGPALLAPGRPPRFGFDAIRVPLHLAWAGFTEEPALVAASQFWSGHAVPPAWVDLASGEASADAASPAVVAIARLAQGCRHGRVALATLPRLTPDLDYYAASLTLLTRIAAREAPLPGHAALAEAMRPAPTKRDIRDKPLTQ